MGTYNPGITKSRTAGVNNTAFRFFKDAAAGTVDRCTVAGERPDGVIAGLPGSATQFTQTAGDEIGVWEDGDVEVESGAAVVDNAEVMTDATGRAITYAAAGTGLTNYKAGKVINGTSAAGAGERLAVKLYKPPIGITTP